MLHIRIEVCCVNMEDLLLNDVPNVVDSFKSYLSFVLSKSVASKASNDAVEITNLDSVDQISPSDAQLIARDALKRFNALGLRYAFSFRFPRFDVVSLSSSTTTEPLQNGALSVPRVPNKQA